MKGFLLLAAVVLAAIGIGVGIEAAAPPSSASVGGFVSPPAPVAQGGKIRVAATGPCPASIAGYHDVENPSAGIAHRLLPAGARFGVICRYGEGANGNPYVLVRTSLVNGRTAARFEQAIATIGLSHPTGVAFCPAEFAQAAILAFGYPHRPTVDLWYADSGCQTLDNGYLEAYEVANPGFFDHFVPLIERISP